MQQFEIILRSFRQVQDFVALALQQTFDITVGNNEQTINGKDLLGMFSLDYSRPLYVQAHCSPEELRSFEREAHLLLGNSHGNG